MKRIPSLNKSNVEQRRVEINKLKQENFESITKRARFQMDFRKEFNCTCYRTLFACAGIPTQLARERDWYKNNS